MLNLVNQVLDYSKLETEKLQLVNAPFNLHDTINELITSFSWEADSKNLKLLYEIENTIPQMINGDKLRMAQVLINIVSNAVKFSESGTVKLTANKIKEEDATVCIYFEVSDNGIGISAEKRDVIFDSFTQADAETTRKYGGTGLGLSISKKLIDKMGGSLEVKNNEPTGSIFYFTVSFSKVTVDNHINNETVIKNLSGKNILLVEDNAVNMMVAKRMLTKWGASVTEAIDGKKGYSIYRCCIRKYFYRFTPKRIQRLCTQTFCT
jgi:K+-sensing histidine kinase KdpD